MAMAMAIAIAIAMAIALTTTSRFQRLSMATLMSSLLILLQQLLLLLLCCHGIQPTMSAHGGNRGDDTRREVFRSLLGTSISATTAVMITSPMISLSATTITNAECRNLNPFVYSDSWTGTCLTIQYLEDAVVTSNSDEWTMGRWPDPILRHSANPIDPTIWLGSSINQQKLQRVATMLRDTARREGAVGLAAQQVGIDAKMIYLSSGIVTDSTSRGIISRRTKNLGMGDTDKVFINPRIVDRSPESNMKVWKEECLVLPPTFRATVLRDDWIDVEYDYLYEFRPTVELTTQVVTPSSANIFSEQELPLSIPMQRRFFGEQSRCLQHELDHDRGILITDHVGLDELENDVMRQIEANGHDQRMIQAYSREYNNTV